MPGPNDTELLLRDANITVPPAFMGASSEGQVSVRNVGVEPVSIVGVTAIDGDDTFTLPGLVGTVIDPQSDAMLTVRFAPGQADDATLAEVEHHATVQLTLSGAREGEDRVTLELTGIAAARDCYVPATLDFGRVPLLQAIEAPLTFRNGSPLPTTTTWGNTTGADPAAFVVDLPGSSADIAAGSELRWPVRFQPLEERAYTASIQVKRGDGCPSAILSLTGLGDAQALSWSPAQLEFGRVALTATSTTTVTVVNRSRVALSLAARVGTTQFAAPQTPTEIPASGSAVVNVAFTPDRLGPLTDELTMEIGTVPPTLARVALTGVGGGPRIRVDPAPLQFGVVPLQQTTRRRIVVQNVGTAPPAPGDPSNNLILGASAGALPWFAIVPKNEFTLPSEFGVTLSSAYDAGVGLPAIAGQNFAEFELTITPLSGTSQREADLLVYSNDSSQPVARVAISANPRLPESCSVTFSPEGADFGSAPPGATITRTIVVTNTSSTGGSNCLVSGIEMAPGSNYAFQVIDPGVQSLIVPRGQPKNIRITATVPADAQPSEYLRGTLRAQVSGERTVRTMPVDLRVSRCLVLDPPRVDLGLVQTGCTSASKPVNVYNLCGLPITLTGIAPLPAPFRITSSPIAMQPLELSPADHTSILVAAAPTMAGSFSTQIKVQSQEGMETHEEVAWLEASASPTGSQTETFTQSAAAVDILFVIDDSCSMADEQAALSTNFAAFMSSASQSSGDWHIGVVTTDATNRKGVLVQGMGSPSFLTPATPNVAGVFANKVQVGTSGSGLEQPYLSMSLAVTAPNRTGANAGFLRTDASLAVIIVTDAVEQSPNAVGSYLTTLRQVKNNRPELLSISVVGPFSAPSASCNTEGLVDDGRYEDALTATSGVKADICTANWAMDLEAISRNVFGARRTFELAGTPRNAGSITVKVDGVAVAGWRLDTTRNAIVFTSPPAPMSTITVDYLTACF